MKDKCPRCGLMADAVKAIRAEGMPGVNGANRFHLVGHVYYHSSGIHCAIPRVGKNYAIYPPKIHIVTPATGDVPVDLGSRMTDGTIGAVPAYPNRGTDDSARSKCQT